MRNALAIRRVGFRLLAMVLLLGICVGTRLPVRAASVEPKTLFAEGWEKWSMTCSRVDGVMNYDILCPERNVSIEAMQAYTLDVMSYCKEKNPGASRVVIRFPYDNEEDAEIATSTAISFMGSVAFNVTNGLRALTNSFLNLSRLKVRSGDNPEIILVLDVNNPNTTSIFASDIPVGEAMPIARKIAADIQAKTAEPRSQIAMLNDELVKRIDYGYAAVEERAYSTLGALVDGKAICAGYTNAVNDVCYLLGIPSYQINDTQNRHIWNVVKIDGKWLMLDVTGNDTVQRNRTYFLAEDLRDADHQYNETLPGMLAGYADRLWQASETADRLSAKGMIHGTNAGFALSEAVTHEIAVLLTRLDSAEEYVAAHAARLSEMAGEYVRDTWAAPYIGYCAERGYFAGDDANIAAKMTVTRARRILLDYFAITAMADLPRIEEVLYAEKWTANGEILLRGDLFQMLEQCME